MKISSILRGLLAYPAGEARASGAPWDGGWADDPMRIPISAP